MAVRFEFLYRQLHRGKTRIAFIGTVRSRTSYSWIKSQRCYWGCSSSGMWRSVCGVNGARHFEGAVILECQYVLCCAVGSGHEMVAGVWRTAAQSVKAFRIEGFCWSFLFVWNWRKIFGVTDVCLFLYSSARELPAWRQPFEQATVTSLPV